MPDGPPAPIPPFRDAVARRARVPTAAVDALLSELGIVEEKATHRPESLTVHRLMFSGQKRASGWADGPYTFEWSGLGPGHWGVLSDGINQIGKTTVLEVMLWALRGRTRGLKPEVRAWIDTVEMDFAVGTDRYQVAFTDEGDVPRGSLMIVAPGPPRTLEAFEGEEPFEAVMGDLMMQRFGLQPIPHVRHEGADGAPTPYVHAWNAYAASLFIEGSHPAILGDVTVGALWWRMLQLFVGMPYAGTHMALRNALALDQAGGRREVSLQPRRGHGEEIRRLEAELDRYRSALAALGDAAVSRQEVDALMMENTTLARAVAALDGRIAEAERAASAAMVERNEARAVLRRLEEGTAVRHVFAGLKPVCCPRCSAPFSKDRTDTEDTGRCSVCDRDSLNDDSDAVTEALAEARHRIEALTQYARAAREGVDELTAQRADLQQRRAEIERRIAAIEAQTALLAQRRGYEEAILKLTGALEERRKLATEARTDSAGDRSTVLVAAAAVAEARMKAAGAELFRDLEREVVAVARGFGFRGLEAIAIRGNGIMLTVSGVQSGFSRQTAGQRLRLRVALVVAMIRLAERSGIGHHPGLLFIDSPGGEELSDDDLHAMLYELGQVVDETDRLQIFVASSRGNHLHPVFRASNVIRPGANGTIF